MCVVFTFKAIPISTQEYFQMYVLLTDSSDRGTYAFRGPRLLLLLWYTYMIDGTHTRKYTTRETQTTLNS